MSTTIRDAINDRFDEIELEVAGIATLAMQREATPEALASCLVDLGKVVDLLEGITTRLAAVPANAGDV